MRKGVIIVAKRRHLNVILTEDEYSRVKKALPTHGAISTITRTLLLRFVKNIEQEKVNNNVELTKEG